MQGLQYQKVRLLDLRLNAGGRAAYLLSVHVTTVTPPLPFVKSIPGKVKGVKPLPGKSCQQPRFEVKLLARTPMYVGCVRFVAPKGFEPLASLVLSQSGLPVA